MATEIFKRTKWIILALAGIGIITTLWIIRKVSTEPRFAVVHKGTFEKFIETKGEIHGKNAVNITISDIFKDQDIQVWDFRIKDMVAEGTIVKKGDWVASLDQTNLKQRIQVNQETIDNRLANLNDAKIDSALMLNQLRQQIRDLEFNLKYSALDLEQSKFESPAYQRRMLTKYQQNIRQIERRKREYELRKMDLAGRTRREEDRYDYFKDTDTKLQQALEATNITAPFDGMVIYARMRWGRKIRIGDDVNPQRPVIATLPDLSVLVSETYVEEIDIAKINIGDSVAIHVDALPDKKFGGTIIKIANIGQEMSGYDTKVFGVTIEFKERDKKLLPGMSCSNTIILNRISNVITIPRKCLFTEDGHSFVYLRKEGKIRKKIVKPGLENDEMIIIESGLAERDRILTILPEDAEQIGYRD
jgi:RND family efflux transporter MFP subunit